MQQKASMLRLVEPPKSVSRTFRTSMNMFLLDLVITVLIITIISYNDLGISCYRDISIPHVHQLSLHLSPLFATLFCWVSSSTSSASATNLQPIPFPWIFFWLRNRFAVFNDTCNTSLLPWGLVSPSTSPWTFDSCRSQLRSGQVRQKLLTKWWYEQVWVGISEHFQTAVYRNVCV